MSRPYAPRAVFQHLPLDLVREFLDRQKVLVGVNWAALVEGDTRELYQVWLDLPPAARDAVEEILRHIHEMATPAGTLALVADAFFHGSEVVPDFNPIDGHHAKALWVLIHHPPGFQTLRLSRQRGIPGRGGQARTPNPAAIGR